MTKEPKSPSKLNFLYSGKFGHFFSKILLYSPSLKSLLKTNMLIIGNIDKKII